MKGKVKSITRFPGGKSRSLKYLKEFLELSHDSYREPFIGGCTVFLGKNKVKYNWINDLDYDIYAMHKTIRDNPDKLIEYIKEYTPPTIDSYNQIKDDIRDDIIWMGFRTLFLNRCSYNGMMHGGAIGGRNQTGNWLVDCCWKKDTLIERVKTISEKLKGVKITCLDFEELIKKPGENVLLYLDPPYVLEGNKLYKVGMSLNDHERLRNLLYNTEHNFLLSYRDCKEVRELYKDTDKFVILERTWTYSMMTQSKNGCQQSNELFIMNYNLYNKYLEKQPLNKIKNKYDIKNLKEGDIFITKKNNKGQLLKKLDNDKYLLKNLDNNKEYEISLSKNNNSKNINLKDNKIKIVFNSDKIKGEFDVTGLNNEEHNESGDRFEKWDGINDYHLNDNNGMLRIYDGKFEPHYYHYVKNGETIPLKKEDFNLIINSNGNN